MKPTNLSDRLRRATLALHEDWNGDDERADGVLNSGAPAFCGTLWVSARWPSLSPRTSTWATGPDYSATVAVHPGGLVLTDAFGTRRAILLSEIEQVRVVGRAWMTRMIVWHHAPQVGDPLWIHTRREGDAARAITALLTPHASGLLPNRPPLRDHPPEG